MQKQREEIEKKRKLKEPFIPASLRPPVKVAYCKSLAEIDGQPKIIKEETDSGKHEL